MHHFMRLYPDSFTAMRTGQKKSELRLNDEKRQKIRVGDTIEFTNTADPNEKLTATVIHLNRYRSFSDLFEGVHHDYPDYEKEGFIGSLYNFYTKEDEIKYGALEIGICFADGET